MIDELKKQLPEAKEYEPLAVYTTFKIGGPARYFFSARSAEDIERAVGTAREQGIPFFVLGGASNILVSDQGFNGLVILNKITGCEFINEDARVVAKVGAGEIWDDFVAQCVGRGLTGVECLSGIPGTVGAAPVQNIGAYGQSVDAVIKEVWAYDAKEMKEVMFNAKACAFSYRDSIFKKESGRYIITRVTLALKPGGAPLVQYHDLKEYFYNPPQPSLTFPPKADQPRAEREGASGDPPLKVRGGRGSYEISPSLADVRKAVIDIRARKGYIIMPGYESFATAGSFFKNPIIAVEQFQGLLNMLKGCAEPWYWPVEDVGAHNPPQSPLISDALKGRSPTEVSDLRGDRKVKISAACLLQSAGFFKGYRRGRVGISPKHALSLMNYEGALARDIFTLAQDIRVSVLEKFGVSLEMEVQMVGDFPLV